MPISFATTKDSPLRPSSYFASMLLLLLIPLAASAVDHCSTYVTYDEQECVQEKVKENEDCDCDMTNANNQYRCEATGLFKDFGMEGDEHTDCGYMSCNTEWCYGVTCSDKVVQDSSACSKCNFNYEMVNPQNVYSYNERTIGNLCIHDAGIASSRVSEVFYQNYSTLGFTKYCPNGYTASDNHPTSSSICNAPQLSRSVKGGETKWCKKDTATTKSIRHTSQCRHVGDYSTPSPSYLPATTGYCNEGAYLDSGTVCKACPSGHYMPSMNKNPTCLKQPGCTAGKYYRLNWLRPLEYQADCTACKGDNKYQDELGHYSTECKTCPDGQIATNDKYACHVRTTITTTTTTKTTTTTNEDDALHVGTFVAFTAGTHAGKHGVVAAVSATGISAQVLTCDGPSLTGMVPLRNIGKQTRNASQVPVVGDRVVFRYGPFENQNGTVSSSVADPALNGVVTVEVTLATGEVTPRVPVCCVTQSATSSTSSTTSTTATTTAIGRTGTTTPTLQTSTDRVTPNNDAGDGKPGDSDANDDNDGGGDGGGGVATQAPPSDGENANNDDFDGNAADTATGTTRNNIPSTNQSSADTLIKEDVKISAGYVLLIVILVLFLLATGGVYYYRSRANDDAQAATAAAAAAAAVPPAGNVVINQAYTGGAARSTSTGASYFEPSSEQLQVYDAANARRQMADAAASVASINDQTLQAPIVDGAGYVVDDFPQHGRRNTITMRTAQGAVYAVPVDDGQGAQSASADSAQPALPNAMGTSHTDNTARTTVYAQVIEDDALDGYLPVVGADDDLASSIPIASNSAASGAEKSSKQHSYVNLQGVRATLLSNSEAKTGTKVGGGSNRVSTALNRGGNARASGQYGFAESGRGGGGGGGGVSGGMSVYNGFQEVEEEV